MVRCPFSGAASTPLTGSAFLPTSTPPFCRPRYFPPLSCSVAKAQGRLTAAPRDSKSLHRALETLRIKGWLVGPLSPPSIFLPPLPFLLQALDCQIFLSTCDVRRALEFYEAFHPILYLFFNFILAGEDVSFFPLYFVLHLPLPPPSLTSHMCSSLGAPPGGFLKQKAEAFLD